VNWEIREHGCKLFSANAFCSRDYQNFRATIWNSLALHCPIWICNSGAKPRLSTMDALQYGYAWLLFAKTTQTDSPWPSPMAILVRKKSKHRCVRQCDGWKIENIGINILDWHGSRLQSKKTPTSTIRRTTRLRMQFQRWGPYKRLFAKSFIFNFQVNTCNAIFQVPSIMCYPLASTSRIASRVKATIRASFLNVNVMARALRQY